VVPDLALPTIRKFGMVMGGLARKPKHRQLNIVGVAN